MISGIHMHTHAHVGPPPCKHTRTYAHRREASLHVYDISMHFRKTLEKGSRWQQGPCPAELLTVKNSGQISEPTRGQEVAVHFQNWRCIPMVPRREAYLGSLWLGSFPIIPHHSSPSSCFVLVWMLPRPYRCPEPGPTMVNLTKSNYKE